MTSEIRYARSGDIHIAYRIVGNGPIDLVYVPGWISNLDAMWEEPSLARFFDRLASFSRLIVFDKRGTGLSDRVPTEQLPTMEQRMDDVRAVLDAAGSQRAVLFGSSEGGPMSILYAATYPDRTRALAVYGTYAKRVWAPDYPWAPTPEERERWYDSIERGWGGDVDLEDLAPSAAHDPGFRAWWSAFLRRSASPRDALALARMNTAIDIRSILDSVCVPTLIVHRTGDRDIRVEGARWMAQKIPGARLVELPGEDHLPWVGDSDAIVDAVEEFVTGVRPVREPDRVLATVLVTDVVDSTSLVQTLGDRAWRDLLARHHAAVRDELGRFRGRELDTAGDGFLAIFDGPARAVRCAAAVRERLAALDLPVRAGLHTGEVQVHADKVAGIAVHVAARVASLAAAGEILASSTVRDLVAGSGIEFGDRGLRELKGIAEPWRVYEVTAT